MYAGRGLYRGLGDESMNGRGPNPLRYPYFCEGEGFDFSEPVSHNVRFVKSLTKEFDNVDDLSPTVQSQEKTGSRVSKTHEYQEWAKDPGQAEKERSISADRVR